MEQSDIKDKESSRSGIHHSLSVSLNSNQVKHANVGVSRIPQNSLESSALSLALQNVPPRHSKSGNSKVFAPGSLTAFEDENNEMKSKSNAPKKSWEKHFRSFLTKERKKKNNLLHFNKMTLSSPGSNENSLRSGKIFRNMFKSIKDKQKTDHNSSVISASFSGFQSSTSVSSSNVSLDTTIRRGIEKKALQHRSYDNFEEFNVSNGDKNAHTASSFEDNSLCFAIEDPPSTIPSFHALSENFLSEDISPASDDLDHTLHAGRQRDSRDTEVRRSFTEFHSSNEYGKDSTSAYLGRNSSVHKNNLFLHFEKPGYDNIIGLKKNQHLRHTING